MPIKKKKGERKPDFINRCIGVEVGGGMKPNQAAAVCLSYWEEMSIKEMKKKRKEKKMEDTFMISHFSKTTGEDFGKLGLTFRDLLNPKNQFDTAEDGVFKKFQAPPGYDVKYKYMPAPDSGYDEAVGYGGNSRPFCVSMFNGTRMTIWWNREDIEVLNGAPGKADRAGGKPYSVFNWRGGNNCKHIWIRYYYNPTTGDFLRTPVQPAQKSTEPR